MNSDLASYTAVVVDDEEGARSHTTTLLKQFGVGRVVSAASAEECLDIFFVEEDPPDWLFIDVMMPGMDGIELAAVLREQASAEGKTGPSIVYVTGYEEYAIRAFEHSAVDYLLKPVERRRLAGTLERLTHRPPNHFATQPLPAPQFLPIRMDFSVRLVEYRDIIAAFANEKRVEIIARDAVYKTKYSLNQLEARLPPAIFIRIHDAWIINLSEILEIHNLGGQAYQLRLKFDSRLVPVSRRRLPILRDRLKL